jgi:N-acetylmuramoyl-L-alanine amidase
MSRWPSCVTLAAALALAAGCDAASPARSLEIPTDPAASLPTALASGAPLPARAEAVAASDRLAIAAVTQTTPSEARALYLAAARVRERVFRLDGVEIDGRQAVELYAAARRTEPLAAAACDADLAGSALGVELAPDAASAYREVYLASRRADLLVGAQACAARLRSALGALSTGKPEGAAWTALEAEGDREALAVQPAPTAAAHASASPSASSTGALSPLMAEEIARPPASLVTGPAKLTRLDAYGTEEGARVVLYLSAPATFDVGDLAADAAKAKDARIYVDLPKTSAKGVPKERDVGGAVRRVRLGAQAGGATRVVLDLSGKLRRRVFYLPDPFRVVIDVSTRAAAPAPPASASSPAATSASAAPRSVRRVAVDAGHGGEDSGALGPTGLAEKDVTLDIAHRVAPALAHELGLETLLTRDDDTFIPLELRSARANAFHADLFVSIHCNANPDGTGRGVATYVFDEPKEGDPFGLGTARRENGRKGADTLTSDSIRALLPALGPASIRTSSRHLAELLQRSVMASLEPRYPDSKDLGVRTAGFHVLVGTDMPAVLFETSFISNSAEEQRLSKADYRQKLADGIVNAIRAFREGK